MIRVLVVDDKPENLYMLRMLLQGHECVVDEARHGAEALVKARQVPPDLIVSDLLMPVMDGYTLLRRWKADERLKTIPFVVYTATYTEPKDERLALDLGADAFILKPAEPDVFMARLQDLLAKARRSELPARAPTGDGDALLKEYGDVLIRKLEEKALLLEQANRALREELVQRQQAEDRLRESEKKFRALFEDIADGVLVADAATQRFIVSNPQMCRMLGRNPDELANLGIEDIHPAADLPRVLDQFERLVRREIHLAPDIPVCRRDGSVFLTDISGSPLVWEGRACLMGVFRDITERKRLEAERSALEAQLRQQQKLEAIGTLASGVAHEINNPISGIMNYAQLIADKVEPGSRAADYAGEIVRETERVATIVRNLLQFARQEKQSHSPARLADIVEQTLALFRAVLRRDQITLTVEVPDDLPPLKCRSQQIQQVLMNLLTNARDALNEKYPDYHADKTLRISCRPFDHDGRPWLRLTVADQGPGIPAEIQARIFDPFFTTKPRDKGTGLGLSISHGIVKDHHGVLHFETESGLGTQFHLDLLVDNEWRAEGE